MKTTNPWNQFIYRLWAPIYGLTVNRIFIPGRRRAMQLLDLQPPGERVLIVGFGTGANLPFLPAGVDTTGIDLSPDMLPKASLNLDGCPATVKLTEDDAQTLLVDEASFDGVILN